MKAVRGAAAVALAGTALTLAAFAFDVAPLFVPGVGFLLVGLVVPLWLALAARSASVWRELADERVLEGEPVSAVIVIRRGPLGLPGAVLHDPVLQAPVRVAASSDARDAGGRTELHVEARFARRGRHRPASPRLVLGDPLGLAAVLRRADDDVHPPQDVLVLPATEAVRWRLDARGRRRAGLHPVLADEPFDAVDIDGIRPYRPGTPASRIHWQSLARGQGLQERRLQADAHSRPVIVLDARLDARSEIPPADGLGGARPASGPGLAHQRALLDAAVRATASLTLELARAGGCRLLLPGDRRPSALEPDLRGWPALHVRLALVGEDGPVVGGPGRIWASAGLFYVAARPTRIPAALLDAARGGPVALVLPAALARSGREPSFNVSGCHGFLEGGGRAHRRRTAQGAQASA